MAAAAGSILSSRVKSMASSKPPAWWCGKAAKSSASAPIGKNLARIQSATYASSAPRRTISPAPCAAEASMCWAFIRSADKQLNREAVNGLDELNRAERGGHDVATTLLSQTGDQDCPGNQHHR